MKKSEFSNISFVLRFYNQPEEQLFKIIEACFAFLNSNALLTSNPVLWNLPVHLLTENLDTRKQDILTHLRHRMETVGDKVLPKGYSGAFHSLLLRDELEDEVSWVYENPWNDRNTIEESIELLPRFMMPSDIDFFRPEFRGYYHNSVFNWIIAPSLPTGSPFRGTLTAIMGKDKLALPCLFLPAQMQKNETISPRLLLQQPNPLFIIAECSSVHITTTLEQLTESFKKLAKKGHSIGVTTDILSHKKEQNGQPASGPIENRSEAKMQSVSYIDFPVPILPHTPADRLNRSVAFKKRYQLSLREYDASSPEAKEEIKQILLTLAGITPVELSEHEAKQLSLQEPEQRNFIANMPGDTLLNESYYQVELSGGRFRNIIIDGEPHLVGKPIQSYLRIKEPVQFEQLTSFSFESDENERGLREILVLEESTPSFEKTGTLVLDYLFCGDFPYLIISLFAYYPVFSSAVTVSGFAAFELPLFEYTKNDAVRLQAVYPDGKSYTCFITPHEQVIDFPGSTFFFTHGETTFMLLFPELQQKSIEILPVKVVKEKHRFLLYVNPRGSYRSCSSNLVSGIEEHVVFMVAAGTTETLNPGQLSKTVLTKLPPNWSRKTDSKTDSKIAIR